MSHSTNLKQQDILNSQLNAEASNSSNSSDKLIERIQLTGTPFWIIGNKEEGYFATMGKYKITETYETQLEVKKYIEEHQWEIILIITGIVTAQLIEDNEKRKYTDNSIAMNEAIEKNLEQKQ